MPACWLCGDPLHKVAHEGLDEFVWVDGSGSRFGTDADLRGVDPPGQPGAGPEARWAWLRDELDRGTRQGKRKGVEHTWLHWARAREYTMLKVRLEMSGTFHEHRVAIGDLPAWDGPPVPEHCAQPMWRRPSGWHCRVGCGAVLAEVA